MSEVVIEGYWLSPQQRRLWGALGGGRAERACAQVALAVAGVDAGRLRRALEEVCRRHEALRTGFERLTGMSLPLQVIGEGAGVRWREAGRVSDLGALMREERERAAAGEGVALGGCVAEVEGAGPVLAVTAPALCCDLRSLVNVAREVAALSAGEVGEADDIVQYVQFSEWQNQLTEGDGGKAGRAFWREALAASGDGGEVRLGLEAAGGGDEELEWGEVSATWEGAAAESGQEALLSCWVALLGRLSGRSSVPVSVLFDGRKLSDLNESVGLFQTYLPINVNVGENHRFQEVVEKTARELKAAYPWQEYFPEEEGDEEDAGAEAAKAPRHRFGYEYVEWPDAGADAGASLRPLRLSPPVEPFKLCLRALRSGTELRVTLYHDATRVDAGWARLLLGQYESLLRSCLSDPTAPLSRHDALSEEEREAAYSQSGRNSRPYPTSPLLPELIASAVRLDPEAEAVVDGARTMTRGRLWRAAGRVAEMLRGAGVRRGDRVGLLAGRSAEAVAGLLGCWRMGVAYVPLDGSPQPGSRLESMLDDCGARAVLVSGESSSVRGGPRAVLDLGAGLFDEVGAPEGEAGGLEVEAGDIAYLIYTSGTTGRPKGVAVTHGSLLNLLHALDESVYSSNPVRRVSVNAPLWFDASVKQLVQLGLGRSLVVVPEQVRADAEALAEWVVASGVEAFDCTPSHLRALLGAGLRRRCEDSGAALRHLLIGGEAIDEALWAELGGWAGVTSHNLYGPTECTVDVTHQVVGGEGGERPSLGLPLGNVEAYVLDGHGRLCPAGVAGELCAGGAGIAVGYWGDARRTAERFVPDAYSGRPGSRLYRTGDVARRGSEGGLRYEGRGDAQVKVRGFRIELGEIEAALREVAWAGEAAAAVVGEGDSARLVGYVVAHSACVGADCEHDAVIAREYARGLLPEYMVPAQVLLLDSLPLTTNGKLDRKALPAPAELTAYDPAGHSAPRTPHEEMLCGLFAGVLSVGTVGAEDNFFSLGGHSLLATQLMSRVRKGFGVSLPLRTLFERPTPRRLAAEVEAQARAGTAGGPPPLVRAERGEGGELPLSFAQQRLWFLDQLEPGSANYNCPAAVRLSGRLDVGALRRTLGEVLRRHEALRARFVEREGSPVQVIGEAVEVKLPVIDLSGLGEGQREAEARRLAGEQARQGFDLRTGPLLRAAVVRLGEHEHVGLLTTHHIASDAWSKSILVRELSAIYDAYARGEESPLPEPEVQYGDFAAWQREWLQGEALEEQVKYWRAKLSGAPAALELPTDRARPDVLRYRGAHHTFTLPPELSARLVALSRERGVTLYMTLLTVFNILLHRYTGQEDIVVGTAIAGRNQPGVENLIGFFINTLALRTDLSGAPKFNDLLGQLKETALGAYTYQDVPFDKLVEELQPQRSLNRASIVQVTFGLQNVPKNILELPGLTLSAQEFERESGRYDLTLWMSESEGQLRGVWTYLTDLFDHATVERMTAHYETLLASVVADPEARVNALEMYTEAEREELTHARQRQKSSNLKKFKSVVPKAVVEKTADTPGAP